MNLQPQTWSVLYMYKDLPVRKVTVFGCKTLKITVLHLYIVQVTCSAESTSFILLTHYTKFVF